MIKLLICDDHVLVSEGLSLMIQNEVDFTVVKIVDSGRAALDYLSQANDVDILILDLSMPEMNGTEVLQELRSLSIPVYLTSSSKIAFPAQRHFVPDMSF